MAKVFEDFGHENVGTVVKEIFLARWDKDNGAHGKQHSTSRTDMDIRSVNSILRIGSLKGKFQIVDLHTNDKYASMFSDEHLPLLFYHLGDSKNIALQYLVLLRTRRVSPFSPRTFLSYPIEKLSSSFIVAALAMFYPDVFRSTVDSEYEYKGDGTGGTKFTAATVITGIRHSEFEKLVLDLFRKYK